MLKYFLYLLIAILGLSCHEKKVSFHSEIDSDSQVIQACLLKINNTSKIDTLINLGLYNLAFEAVTLNDQNFKEEDKIAIAKSFLENGEFDKSLNIVNQLKTTHNSFEVLRLKILSSLNKQDNIGSKLQLDSLFQLYGESTDIIKKIELKLLQAYYEHNCKNYTASIKLNEEALQNFITHRLPSNYLSVVYHRLGNDYNDIVRDNISYHEDRQTCYSKAIHYYSRELDLLIANASINHTKIALNQITTAMVERAYNPKTKHSKFYELALKELIVANNSSMFITRNPIYTSIALTQYASLYSDYKQKYKLDSLSDLNKKLIDTRSFYKVNDKQSLDIWEYFPQRSQEVRILHEFIEDSNSVDPLAALNLSSSCKYTNLYVNRLLQNRFGGSANQAVNNWILLNELKILAQYNKDSSLLYEAEKRLPKYNQYFIHLNKSKVKRITSQNLLKIKEYCKAENSTILDYQVLHGGSLLITTIDQYGIKCEMIRDGAINKQMVDSLNIYAMSNDVKHYSKMAEKIANSIRINKIKTPNAIICPDEYLENISFEALMTKSISKENWSDLRFIGESVNIRLIPNLNSLINSSDGSKPLQIDIWTSDKDNMSLPYNLQLINCLEKKYSTKRNNFSPENILHVLAHTYQTPENNIELRLNTDTLTVYSNNNIKPSLAILEGCKSGNGSNYKFEGSISQTRCFLYNGTPSVIYSLWDADNHSSTYLFQQFYQYLHEGNSTSEALHKAKRDTRNNIYYPEWTNPYYWANFQLTGSDLFFVH
jgi:hypothetical protein